MSGSFPFSSYLVLAVFALAAGLTIAGALIAALTRRIIRGVSGLMIACIGLAGLYYFLNSPFLALMEILIYVGAVCVTIVFGVMLSEPDEPPRAGTRRAAGLWAAGALAISAAIFWGVSFLSLRGNWVAPAGRVSDGSIRAIGVGLLTTYSMAFELISLVLLVAILGALVIARSGRAKV
ncbi:MAG TPA: NADH-quinone oxidoreductase subunit J [Opitutaceae bacterium]|nr:NADH-quinone oxidoreductase subunit J [Opitutaceae bacterium]